MMKNFTSCVLQVIFCLLKSPRFSAIYHFTWQIVKCKKVHEGSGWRDVLLLFPLTVIIVFLKTFSGCLHLHSRSPLSVRDCGDIIDRCGLRLFQFVRAFIGITRIMILVKVYSHFPAKDKKRQKPGSKRELKRFGGLGVSHLKSLFWPHVWAQICLSISMRSSTFPLLVALDHADRL